MSPYGFVNCDKCTTLIEDVNNRGNWGWDIWELYTTFSETVLKLKVYLKKYKAKKSSYISSRFYKYKEKNFK